MDTTEKRYYKSDFDFILDLADIEGISHAEIADCDLEGIVFTGATVLGKHYTFGRHGGEYVNCEPAEGSKVRVLLDNHGLPAGLVKVELRVQFADPDYPDGRRDITCRHELPIELVKDGCYEASTQTIQCTLPYIYASCYDLAREQGYTGTREEYWSATVNLTDIVRDAQQTLEQSQQAAETATRLTEGAQAILDGAVAATTDANEAARSAESAKQKALNYAQYARNEGDAARDQANRARAVADAAEQFARKDRSNTFTSSQTISGTLTVEGDIVVNGETYVVQAEEVRSANDRITMRDGAVGGLGAHAYSGFEIRNYNGTDTCLLAVNAQGEARVGDYGMGADDTQPLLTREETANLRDGDLLRWDASRMCAVPLRIQPIDLEATYEDDPEHPVTYWLVSLPGYVPPANNA